MPKLDHVIILFCDKECNSCSSHVYNKKHFPRDSFTRLHARAPCYKLNGKWEDGCLVAVGRQQRPVVPCRMLEHMHVLTYMHVRVLPSAEIGELA